MESVRHCGRCLYIYARTHPTPYHNIDRLFLLRPRRLLSQSQSAWSFLDQERSPMYSVERAMAKAAASLLPGLLPTPPTKPCLIILPASFASKPNPKPGRADSVERWDAHKKDKRPTSPASSCSSSSSSGRASSCERWDINKQFSNGSCTSSSSLSSSRRSSTSSGGALPCGRWDSNKRLPPSRASSPDRWDTHKKPHPAQASAEIWTSDKDKEQEDDKPATVLKPTAPRIGPMFSGPSFLSSPVPSMLPMPAFFRSRNLGPGVLAVQAC